MLHGCKIGRTPDYRHWRYNNGGKERTGHAIRTAIRTQRCNRYALHGDRGARRHDLPEAGRFRSGNVGVFDGDALIHAGTPAAYVPEVMADIFGWLEKTSMHPLVASCIFHFEFEFCHPFFDGNGRTGRLWHTLLLSKWRPALAWLPIESTIRQRQAGYYEALAKSDAIGSSERFVEFMLDVIRNSILPFSKPANEKELTRARALDFFRERGDGSISRLAEHLGCSKRSAERIVAGLKEEGSLARQGSARSGIWIVHEN